MFVGWYLLPRYMGLSCLGGRKQLLSVRRQHQMCRRGTPKQYAALEHVVRSLARQHPLTDIAGHEHIAPGRKRDPGPGFDWVGVNDLIRELSLRGPTAPGDEAVSGP